MIVSHNRVESLRQVLTAVAGLLADEIIVADNGSTDASPEVAIGWGGNVSLLALRENLGVAARNRAVRRARGDLILMLDDDSYPLPGALEVLVQAFRRDPLLGIAGGRVVDVDPAGTVIGDGTAPGSFDWFLRPRDRGGRPATAIPPASSRNAAASFVAGHSSRSVDASSRTSSMARNSTSPHGWSPRDGASAYFPQAAFAHRRPRRSGRSSPAVSRMLRYRIRNQIWYFWLRFPLGVAVRRIPAYLASISSNASTADSSERG